MDLFPAIDLQNGRCVRLKQGDFKDSTIYNDKPATALASFADAGAKWVHMVDLDGAREGEMRQYELIKSLTAHAKVKIQIGGGVRSAATIQHLLDAGVERVVVGSLAVKEPNLVGGWMSSFGADKIVLAIDVRLNEQDEPEALTNGWQQGSHRSMWDVLSFYVEGGLKTLLCTDVTRDGMMVGANVGLYQSMRQRYPDLNILASGGVKDQRDLQDLNDIGVAGVVFGKALYEGKIDLASALRTFAA